MYSLPFLNSSRRDSGEKVTLNLKDGVAEVKKLLDNIQGSMFVRYRCPNDFFYPQIKKPNCCFRASKELSDNLSVVKSWKDFLAALDKNHMIQAPFCGDIKCEEEIKELSKADADLEPGAPSMGAKSLCIPFQQPAQIGPNDKCVRYFGPSSVPESPNIIPISISDPTVSWHRNPTPCSAEVIRDLP